jgi:hypothetical protein
MDPWLEPVLFEAASGSLKTSLLQTAKAPPRGGAFESKNKKAAYNVDSSSKPQASKSASGIYLEFLLRRAHSRRRVDRIYWSGLSLNSLTICSKEVTVGTTGPMGSGLPQFGFPRRFAIDLMSLRRVFCVHSPHQCFSLGWGSQSAQGQSQTLILRIFSSKINSKMLCFRSLP